MKILILMFLPFMLFAIEGKVVKVADGDTLTVLTKDNKQIRIRLYGIDAPESKQAFGRKSKENLSSLCAGQYVKVDKKDIDRYERVVGIVYCQGIDSSRKQVIDGYAWAYTKYSTMYAKDEREAKVKKRGLWREAAIAPWDYRKMNKQNKNR